MSNSQIDIKRVTCNCLLTSVVAGTVDYGVILLMVPSWILFFTRKRRARFCHLTGVLTAPARVHSAPVQTRTSR